MTTECPHGFDLHRTTRDGWPLCPWCRRRAKALAPPEPPPVPTITPPRFDTAALAAHDDTLWRDEP